MKLDKRVRAVLKNYELDITDLISVPCKRAYIRMGEDYENGQICVYCNSYMKEDEFKEYLQKKIPEIENSLKSGYLSLDTQDVVIEFENGSSLTVNSSEWLSISFGQKDNK